MEKIDSFKIDHNKLLKGIYVSRKDKTPKGDILTTFDIRLSEPNREDAVDGAALHTIEHLAATFLRNHPTWKEKIIYWGPMGCRTGNYLILNGEFESRDIIDIMKETFAFIKDYEGEIPGATAKDCGNYTYNDLPKARKVAEDFYNEILMNIKPENLTYPN